MNYRKLRIAWSIACCLTAVAALAIFAPLIYYGPPSVMRSRSILISATNPLDRVWLFATVAFAFAAAPWIRWSNRFSLRALLFAMTVAALVLGAVALSVR